MVLAGSFGLGVDIADSASWCGVVGLFSTLRSQLIIKV